MLAQNHEYSANPIARVFTFQVAVSKSIAPTKSPIVVARLTYLLNILLYNGVIHNEN